MSKLQQVIDAAVSGALEAHPCYARYERALREKLEQIAAMTPGGAARVKLVQRLHAADLLLVVAALDRFEPATVQLERLLRTHVTATLKKLFRFEVEDIVQDTLAHAFKNRVLSTYQANGTVAGWACVSGIRRANSLHRRKRRKSQPLTDSIERVLEQCIQRADPTVMRWSKTYGPKLNEAMRIAIAQLSSDQQRLLTWRGQGTTIRTIATSRKQQPARAHRQVVRAQTALRKLVKREFCRLTNTKPADFSDIMRERPSVFHLSVARMLKERVAVSSE